MFSPKREAIRFERRRRHYNTIGRTPQSDTSHQHQRYSCPHSPRGRLRYADRLRRPRWRNGRTITDIRPAEAIAWMALHRRKRGEIAGIGQLVDDQHLVVGVSDKMSDQCRPDEARSTSNNDLHASIHLVSCVRGAGSPSLARLSAHAWHLKAASP